MKYRNKKLLNRAMAFVMASLMAAGTGLTTYASAMEGTGDLNITVGEPEDRTDEVVSVGEPDDGDMAEPSEEPDEEFGEEPSEESGEEPSEESGEESGEEPSEVLIEEPCGEPSKGPSEEPIEESGEEPAPTEEPIIVQGPDGEDYIITVKDPALDEQAPEAPVFVLDGMAGDRAVSFVSGTGFVPGTELSLTAMSPEELDAAAGSLNGVLTGKEAEGVFGFAWEIPGYDGDVDVTFEAGLEEGLALFDGDGHSEIAYDNGFTGGPAGSVLCVALSDIETGPMEYSYEGDGFSVSATVQPESGIPESAILHADKLDGDARQVAFNAVKESLGLPESAELWFEPYDVYFLDGENRIEPVAGLVQVTMSFSQEPFAEVEADREFIAHILYSGEVEEITMEDSGEAMTFSVGSFSIMGPAAVAYAEDDIVTPATDTEGVYAILYADGTMVMQRGNAIHSAHGEMIGGPWTGFETGYDRNQMKPWNNMRNSITSVVVADAIHPDSTSNWFYEFTGLLSADLGLLDTSSAVDMHDMFYNCTSLSALDLSNFDTSSVTTMCNMFLNCSSLSSLDLSSFDTSSVTAMYNMFCGCNSLQSLDLSNFSFLTGANVSNMFTFCDGLLDITAKNVHSSKLPSEIFNGCKSYVQRMNLSGWKFDDSVTSMDHAFYDFRNLSELDLSGWDTGHVTDMNCMFYCCDKLLSLDVSGFDTSMVTNMSGMFRACRTLEGLDLSNFKTSLVTDMSGMFWLCDSLKHLQLSGLDTSSVTDMSNMFAQCSALEHIDVSGFDTSSVVDMSEMFWSCEALAAIDVSNFDTHAVTRMDNMFHQCLSLASLDISGFTFSKNVGMTRTFSECPALTHVTAKNVHSFYMPDSMFDGIKSCVRHMDLSGWVFDESIVSMRRAFYNFISLQSLDLSGWDTSRVTNMAGMFSRCLSLSSLDLSGFDTRAVTNMSGMFNECQALKALDLSGFDTRAVTNMNGMFNKCVSLDALDLSCFSTDSVVDMALMFYGCNKLKSLDLSNFDTSSVTSMKEMFYDCRSLSSLDLSSFDTGSVNDMSFMFYRCQKLTDIDLSSFDTSSVTTMQCMFYYCTCLASLDLSNFDTGSVLAMQSMFEGCGLLSSIDMSGFTFLPNVNTNGMFTSCSHLFDVTAKNVHSAMLPVSIFGGIRHSLSHMDLSGWTFYDSVRSLENAFTDFSKLAELNVDGWDTSHITSMKGMFYGCTSLGSLDVSSFDTSNCVDFRNMFFNCSNLSILNISGFDFSRADVHNAGMFSYCGNLKELYARDCGVLAGIYDGYERLFCERSINAWYLTSILSQLEVLDLSGSRFFEAIPSNLGACTPLTLYRGLFADMPSLRELNLSGVTTEGVTDMTDMFADSPDLKKLTLDKDFHFIEGQDTSLQPNWMNVKTGVVYENLQASYQGGDMAGTYVREDIITFDTIYDGKLTVPGYLDRPATLPENPYIKGRTFLGWFTDKTGDEQLKAGDTVTQLTYYAHYRDWEYDLVTDPNGGDGDRQTYHLSWNSSQKLPGSIYSYPDKVFAGWNTRKDGTGAFYSGSDTVRRLAASDGDTVTLYAQWSDPEDTVKIIFDAQGGTAVPSREVVRGGDSLRVNDFTPYKAHHTFIGWLFDLEAYGDGLSSVPDGIRADHIVKQYDFMTIAVVKNLQAQPEFVGDSVTLHALYVQNPVVTFDLNDGTGVSSTKEYNLNSVFGELPVPNPSDGSRMSFIGWFTEPQGGDVVTETTSTGNFDRTVYAHWGWRPVLDTDGGVLEDGFAFAYQESSDYVLDRLPEITRDGHTFDGWYYGDRLLKDGDVIDLTQPLDMTAHWTAKQEITVTFKYGSNLGSSISYKGYAGEPFGSFYKQTSYPSKSVSGYGTVYAEFLGWKDEDGNYRNPGDVFDKDTVLTADYVWPECILTFDPDGGSNVYGTKVSSNKTVVPKGKTLWSLPGTKKTNYILEGWYTEKDGQGEKLTIETVHEESRTWYAHWVPFYLNADDTNSLYVYGAEWSNASNSDVSNQGDNLDVHPSSNSSFNASLHVRFELNKSIGDVVLPVGSVKIKVPGYIWKDWDGNNIGTNNISANFPQYPAVRNGMWFSYQKDGDDFVLINSKELSGSAGLDFTINYSVSPRNVPGGAMDYISKRYIDGYDFYQGDVPVQFSVDSDLDGTAETDVSKGLTVEMHTFANRNISKRYNAIYYSWPFPNRPAPVDADEYFYIQWYVGIDNVTYSQESSPGPIIEGVHSGSIVLVDTYYVYTKHKLSDLFEAGNEGLTLYNECYRDLTWKSGYVERRSAKASTTVYVADYPKGEYSKYNNNQASTSVVTTSGGQEDILDDGKEVALTWWLKYNGGSNVEPVWNESDQTYSLPKRTIRIQDGMPGDVLYSSGSASKPYVWEPSTGNVALSDSDYYFSAVGISCSNYDGWHDDSGWHTGSFDRTDIEPVHLYIRRAGSDDYVYYRSVDLDTSAGTVINYAFEYGDVVGFELRHDTDSYSTRINCCALMKLKPTERVKSLLQDDVDLKKGSVIKNSSTCDIWTTALGEEAGAFFHVTDNTGGSTAANKNCYNLTVSRTYQYTKKSAASQSQVIFDVERGTQDDRMYIGTWNYNNGNRKKRLNAGTFYDLLPAGTSVDPGTLKGYYITANVNSSSNWFTGLTALSEPIDKGWYDVRFEPNWEDSGRTMMIIKVAVPEQYKSTGIAFNYLLHNTYENVMEHGTTVENDVAFVDSTENRVPPYSASGSITTITDKMYYQGLEDAYSGKITYAKANTNYIPVDAYSWGFDKSVQSISEYAHEVTVLPNTTYTYRLAYSQSDYATSSNLVFYDILEGGFDGNESQWHGTFQSVNAESASGKLTDGSTTVRCQPVVYYSTKDRSTFTGEDFDVTKKDVWSTVCPYDKTKVTAVAVDCSKNDDGTDFVMKGKQALEVYIQMRAPKDAENVGKTAYNEGVLWAVHGEDESPTPEYSDASTTIQDVDPEIHKSSTPESGTETKPTLVYQDDAMSYHLSVTNPSTEFTLNDIVVEDTIPAGLRADDTNLMVHFGNPDNALPVMKSPRVEFRRNGQKLVLTISSLLPGETIHFDIPCGVLVKEGVLENTAYITQINGIDKHFESETTWHEAQPTGMAILKTGAFGNALPGAKMQLLDESGQVVHEWTSTDRTYHMEVKAGTYTVHEAEAPVGHFLAPDVTVVLTRQGDMLVEGEKVSPLIMQDDYTKVSVAKADMDGNLIGGAKLAIYRPSDFEANELKDGAVPVLEWESVEGEAKELFGQLQQGEEYVLYESQAPEGLVTADPVWFTVNADGAAQTVTMVDYPEGRQVLISKKDVEGNMLPGAELTLTGPEGFEAVSWTSTDAPKLFVLPAGEYVLHETQAPTGYKLAEDVRFTVALDAEDALAVIMEDPYEAYDLSVGKTVAGNMGDKTKAFSFKLTLDKNLGTLTYVKNGETGSLEPEEDGSYLFTLAHGETITVQGIRYGTGYTVMETGSDGYTVEVSGDNASGTITEADVTVSFVNTRNEGMPTGFVAFTGVSGALALAAGSGWIVLIRRRKKRQDDDLEFLDDV